MAMLTRFRIILLALSVSGLGLAQVGGGGGGAATRIVRGAGAPTTGCAGAGDVGKVYIQNNVAASTSPMYACSKTGASSFGWVNSGTASGGSGTVLDVAVAGPSWMTWNVINPTTHPSFTATVASQTANFFLAAPNGSAGAMTPRAIVAADIPTLNQATTANAGTATALAANGSNCSGGTPLAAGVDASGNAEGCTGLAPTATALAANPANCSAGNAPLGVDASGAAEGCYKTVQQFFGTAAPGSVTGNLPGDRFSDTTNHNDYWCNAASGTAAPACTTVTAGGWTLANGGGGGSISGLTATKIPKAASSTTIADSSITDDGITVSTTETFKAPIISTGSTPPSVTAGTGGGDAQAEGTAPSVCPTAGVDCVYADATQHGWLANFNNGGYKPLVQGPTSSTSGNAASFNATNGGLLQDAGGPIPANTAATTNQFFTAYTQSSGAFTKAQPACANLSDSAIGCSASFATNAQTSTYQVVAADFTNMKTIIVASGTFTITLVASGAQPADGKQVCIVNYGSGVVTIARSGQNINGGTASLSLPASTATAPTGACIKSNGTDYFAYIDGVNASSLNGTPFAGTSGNLVSFGASNIPTDAGFLASNAVRKDTTNTGAAAMTLDRSASTTTNGDRVPNIAGAAPTTAGAVAYDTTNKNLHVGANAVDNLVAVSPATVSPTDGDCTKWKIASGVRTLDTAGAACGSGSAGSAGSFLFSTTASTTVTATSATTLIGTVQGSLTIPVNTFAAGQVMKIETQGYYSTPATPVSLTIDLKIGGTTRITTGAVVQLASVSNGVWKISCNATTRTTGASGTQIANCIFEGTGATLTPGEAPMFTSSTWTVDTTATQAIDIQATWSTTTGAPTITATNVIGYIPGSNFNSWNGDGVLFSNTASQGTVTAVQATFAAHKFYGNNTASTATPGAQSVTDADLSFTDVPTNNASTSNHGLLLKLDNDPTHFMNGQGGWALPNTITKVDLTGQTANISATTLLTPASNLYYRFSCTIIETTVGTGTGTSTIPACNVVYTDVDSNVATTKGVTSTSSSNTLGLIGNQSGGQQFIVAKSGVAVQYSTSGYSTQATTTMQYAIHVRLEPIL